MTSKLVHTLVASLALCPFVAAQSVSLFVETDQIFSSAGDIVNRGDTINAQPLNAFFATTQMSLADLGAMFADTTDLTAIQNAFGSFSWQPMEPWADPAQASWALMSVPLSVGDRPLVAFMNASGPGDLEIGSEIGLVGSAFIPQSEFDNFINGFTMGQQFSIVVGNPGSLQLVAIPEPRVYAALFGLFALGFVMWRRRNP